MGQLLGLKLVASEFVGYIELANLKDINNSLHFGYQKSILMASYLLCGFANFASIGIQVGGISVIAPRQRKNLSELGLKAMIGGTIVSLMSATIAGGWFTKETIQLGKKRKAHIVPTAAFMDIKDEVMANAADFSAIPLPMLVPPKDWTNEPGGYLLNEVM